MAKESGSVPFRWWIERNVVNPIDMSDLPPFDWPGWEARYDNELERRKNTTRKIDKLSMAIQEIFTRMRSEYWQNDWSTEMGYRLEDDPTLHGGGLHVTYPGGRLQTHLDYAAHPYLPGKERRLNLIAFLNPEWREEWGGALQLCDPMGVPVKEIYPEPGMVMGFETGDDSYHGVAKVTGWTPRVTAAVYYLSDLRPGVTRRRALYIPSRGSM